MCIKAAIDTIQTLLGDEAGLSAVLQDAENSKDLLHVRLSSGRKAFQKSMKDGVALLNAIQNVYRCKEIDVA
ncbi:MAG: hypothetical protein GXY41_00265 [Phycisphaerae bacterium]|jgi:class I fructose-bisphosphate aldolase|nr:hypothetical protein [Phycisphaerae bacterium]